MALSTEEMDRLGRLLDTRKASNLDGLTKPSFSQDAIGDVKETFSNIGDAFNRGKTKVSAPLKTAMDDPDGNLGTDLKALGQSFGAGAGALSEIIGDTVIGAGKTVLPQDTEEALADTTEAVVTPIVESAPAQAIMQKYNELDEDSKRTVDALLGTASLATDLASFGVAGQIKKPVVEAVKKTVDTAVDASKVVVPAVQGVGNFAKGTAQIAKDTAKGFSKIPGNMAVNVAEKEIKQNAINALPTTIAKQAAEAGIDVPDVKTVLSVAEGAAKQSTYAKELYETVKKFARGETKTDPIEIVGKPIVARLKTLDKGLAKVGQELGEVAKNLGTVTSKEIAGTVFKTLAKVPGLKGLTVSPKGILNFKDTVLSTALTKSDRQAIQKVFLDAIKSGTGRSKHLLRQELFEVLDGKKKSLTNITATQDKAFQAIRQALSEILEGKNKKYKVLSNQYRKIIQPLSQMRKMMGEIPGASEDILDMQAGLLARRLTSFAKSNPQVRAILHDMDAALGEGKRATTYSVEALQDLYNVLDKYYDIAGKTSFQGQTKAAIDGSNLLQFIQKKLTDIGGETAATRQKALESVFDELFK